MPSRALNQPYLFVAILTSASVLAACDGEVKISFDSPTANINVMENSTAPVWSAQSHLVGTVYNVSYTLEGVDRAVFNLDKSSGVLTFKQPADFEQPLDADRDNKYNVVIKASNDKNAATQNLTVSLSDQITPSATFVEPKPYQNVGNGSNTEVTAVVKLLDAESNTPLKTGRAMLNGIELSQSAQDLQLWTATLTVPKGGLDVELFATADNKAFKQYTKWLNKPDALAPFLMGPSKNNSLFVYDPVKNLIADLDLASNKWGTYFADRRLNPTKFVLDFDPKEQTIYFFIDLKTYTAGDTLLALNFSSLPVSQIAGTIPGAEQIIWDDMNKRVIILVKTTINGAAQYQAAAVSKQTGFFNSFPLNPQTFLLWTQPANAIEGEVKDFAYYSSGKLFIIASQADESNNTHIKTYHDNGQLHFEAMLGPDIGNLLVDQRSGILYVAENHHGTWAALKTIDLNTGQVGVFGEQREGLAVGAYSDIRLNSAGNLMYIGDTVSASIFTLDLYSKKMQELPIVFDPSRKPVITVPTGM